LDRYKDLNEMSLDMLVNEAIVFAQKVVDPLQESGEEWGVKFEDGKVYSPPEFRNAFKQYGLNGFTAAARETKYGGQGFPHMMRIVINDLMYGACQSFNMLPSLTHGAAHLIETFATSKLKELFVPKMYKGDWAGTMCLTEPDAGSNLASIQTTAYREGDHFKIKGTKTFISWGDHDVTENIIHLLLARIEDAPPGVKGISLFIVPKVQVKSDCTLGKPNDVICGGVEKKLGVHASPTSIINFGSNDKCIGYLCGEKNRGLAHMFQMMNQARINSGVSGTAIASTAYQNALAYTKQRKQGTDIIRLKSGDISIIEHPDIRRMLIWMKAMVEGMRSMVYTAAFWTDLSLELKNRKQKKHYQHLVDFITPIIKGYCSDWGFRVCETAIQCLGGYGYCKGFPLEQYLRDIKLLSLYEGTNGIQAIDLMGRKMNVDEGKPYKIFMAEIDDFCEKNRENPAFGEKIRALAGVVNRLDEVTAEMNKRKTFDPKQWASYTYPALTCFGEVCMAWRLLDMALVAHRKVKKGKRKTFYKGKIFQATYFVDITMPHTLARLETCLRYGREIVDMPEQAF